MFWETQNWKNPLVIGVDEEDTRKSFSTDLFNTWQKRHRVRCWQSLPKTPSVCTPESISVQEQKCSLYDNSLSGLWKPHLVCIFCLLLIPEWRFSIFLGNNPTFTNISRSHYVMFWDLTSTLNFLVGSGEKTILFHPKGFSDPYFDMAHLCTPPILMTYITHKNC